MRLASYSEKKYWRVCMRFKIFRRWGESGEYLQNIGEVEWWCGDGPDTCGTCQSRQESGVDYKNLEPSQWSSPHKSDLLLDLFFDAWNILQREKRHQSPVDDPHSTIFFVKVSLWKTKTKISATWKNANISTTRLWIWNSKVPLESPQNLL